MPQFFFDFGSHNGQTIEKARVEFPNLDFYYGFEPVQELLVKATQQLHNTANTFYFNLAVDALAVPYKIGTLYEDGDSHKLGSSLLVDKKLHKKSQTKILRVDADFLFKTLTKPGDSVILKVDIEGKEYDVLNKLLNTGMLQERVSKLFVEWHWHKTTSVSEAQHKELVARLQQAGFNVTGNSKMDEFYDGF